MVLFRLDKQKWTRQNTVLGRQHFSISERLAGWSSAYMHVFAMTLFVAALATLTGLIHMPDLRFWHSVLWG